MNGFIYLILKYYFEHLVLSPKNLFDVGIVHYNYNNFLEQCLTEIKCLPENANHNVVMTTSSLNSSDSFLSFHVFPFQVFFFSEITSKSRLSNISDILNYVHGMGHTVDL